MGNLTDDGDLAGWRPSLDRGTHSKNLSLLGIADGSRAGGSCADAPGLELGPRLHLVLHTHILYLGCLPVC